MVRMTQRKEEKRKEDKHCTRWKSGEEREVEAYMWCWWRPCRAPWLEEGRACPWGTPSAEQPRRECCAPRPAGRRRRGQTPRGAEGGDEKKREGGKWGGGIKKHPLHFTMGIIFSEAAHAHAHSLPVGPASDLVDSTLKPVLQVRVFWPFWPLDDFQRIRPLHIHHHCQQYTLYSLFSFQITNGGKCINVDTGLYQHRPSRERGMGIYICGAYCTDVWIQAVSVSEFIIKRRRINTHRRRVVHLTTINTWLIKYFIYWSHF